MKDAKIDDNSNNSEEEDEEEKETLRVEFTEQKKNWSRKLWKCYWL